MNRDIIIPFKVTEKEKEAIEIYVRNLPRKWNTEWNTSVFIRKLITNEIYYNKSLMK
jgi:hypothetical protein